MTTIEHEKDGEEKTSVVSDETVKEEMEAGEVNVVEDGQESVLKEQKKKVPKDTRVCRQLDWPIT